MEEKDYEALVDMFASDGWKFFSKSVDDLEKALTTAAPDGAVTNDAWQYARGQIQQLRSISGYENYIKLAWEQDLANQVEDNVDFV